MMLWELLARGLNFTLKGGECQKKRNDIKLRTKSVIGDVLNSF